MHRQCKGVEDQAAIKETVESLNRLGDPELIVSSDTESGVLEFRDAVIRELTERFGVRAIAQAPQNSTSVGMVENHQAGQGQSATRELHGEVMDPEHVLLAWCVRFAAFQRVFQRASHSRAMPSAWREKILYLKSSKKKIQITDKFLDGIFLGIKEGSEEFIVGTPALCVECRAVKRWPREDAADPVFFNSIRGAPRRLLPHDEPREPTELGEQPLRIDVRPVHADLPPPISTEPSKPRRV